MSRPQNKNSTDPKMLTNLQIELKTKVSLAPYLMWDLSYLLSSTWLIQRCLKEHPEMLKNKHINQYMPLAALLPSGYSLIPASPRVSCKLQICSLLFWKNALLPRAFPQDFQSCRLFQHTQPYYTHFRHLLLLCTLCTARELSLRVGVTISFSFLQLQFSWSIYQFHSKGWGTPITGPSFPL